jgi:hypothetical protein
MDTLYVCQKKKIHSVAHRKDSFPRFVSFEVRNADVPLLFGETLPLAALETESRFTIVASRLGNKCLRFSWLLQSRKLSDCKTNCESSCTCVTAFLGPGVSGYSANFKREEQQHNTKLLLSFQKENLAVPISSYGFHTHRQDCRYIVVPEGHISVAVSAYMYRTNFRL